MLSHVVAGGDAMARKPTDAVQLKLRFSEALRRRLEREAARNHRSMNTEIIHRLEDSFYRGPRVDQALIDELRTAMHWSVADGGSGALAVAQITDRLTQELRSIADSVIQSAKSQSEDDEGKS
jgi:hypothetical protein